MFLVNSRPGLVTATPFCEGAPLLPKLRGYFAEFLRESCLVPLGILYLPTCVGFGYRYPFVEGRSSFSWEYGISYILQRRSAWYEPRGLAIASPRGSYQALRRLVLGPRLEAFSLPLLTLKKQGHLVSLNL